MTEPSISLIDVFLWVVGLVVVVRLAWSRIIAPAFEWIMDRLDQTPLTAVGRSARRYAREEE